MKKRSHGTEEMNTPQSGDFSIHTDLADCLRELAPAHDPVVLFSEFRKLAVEHHLRSRLLYH